MHFLLSAEILFNKIMNSGVNAMVVNQNGNAGPVYIERNTIVGRVEVRSASSTDGPFYFRNNVIINNDPGNHLFFVDSLATRVVTSDNLVGTASAGIVDSSGLLTNQYGQYRGNRGFEIGDTARPSPPSSLRAE